jgi:hypothetical protein
MSEGRDERPEMARSEHRVLVVWGCSVHRTKPGDVCEGCRDQEELFARSEATTTHRKRRT